MVAIISNKMVLIWPITFIIIMIDIINNIIPSVTAIKELVLCLTTSVVLSQFNFGYFKFIIIPIKCDTNGINIDNIINNIDSIILSLNLMNNIISPINKTGVVMVRAANTLLNSIVFTLIGNDLRILIFLPSRLITELVMEVINDVNNIKTNTSIGKLFIIRSFDIPKEVWSLVSIKITLSIFIDIMIVAKINNTRAKPAFMMKTGILKKVFNSFFIKDLVCELVFIFKLFMFVLLFVVVIFFNLELILKYTLLKINIAIKNIIILTNINVNKSSMLKLVTNLAYMPAG